MKFSDVNNNKDRFEFHCHYDGENLILIPWSNDSEENEALDKMIFELFFNDDDDEIYEQ